MTNTPEKRIEILDKGNTKHRLTITPTRITIKLKEDSTYKEKERITNFFKWIADQYKMKHTLISFRGVAEQVDDDKWTIEMQNDRKTKSYHFEFKVYPTPMEWIIPQTA